LSRDAIVQLIGPPRDTQALNFRQRTRSVLGRTSSMHSASVAESRGHAIFEIDRLRLAATRLQLLPKLARRRCLGRGSICHSALGRLAQDGSGTSGYRWYLRSSGRERAFTAKVVNSQRGKPTGQVGTIGIADPAVRDCFAAENFKKTPPARVTYRME